MPKGKGYGPKTKKGRHGIPEGKPVKERPIKSPKRRKKKK